jgi:hypothetical protein
MKWVDFKGDGIILFQGVADAMKGEKIIRMVGYEVKLIAPSPKMRVGCDLALEINLVGKDIQHVQIMPLITNISRICEVVNEFSNNMKSGPQPPSGSLSQNFRNLTNTIQFGQNWPCGL